MSNSVILFLRAFFDSCWALLTCFHLPGTNVTPAALMLFIASAVIGINFITRVFVGLVGTSTNGKEK